MVQVFLKPIVQCAKAKILSKLKLIVWFQKISIPPPWRELEIPKGREGQRPRKFQRGGGLYDRGVTNRSKSMIEKVIDISILLDIIRY